MIKRCEYCGKEFETRSNRKKYCSYEHYVKDHPDRFSHPDAAIARHKARSIPPLVWEQLRKEAKERKVKS